MRVELLVVAAAVMACPAQAFAQSYSKSAEFRAMLEELRSPAPSPARIAMGVLPGVAAGFAPEARDDDAQLSLSAGGASVTVRKADATLSWGAPGERRWSLSADAGTCQKAKVTQTARRDKAWTVVMTTSCGQLTMLVEPLTPKLTRVTYETTGLELQLHGEAKAPVFGLGERFVTASLAGSALEVRPQDRYGEPGHDWVYVAVPLVYDASGLGFYVDTAFASRFQVDASGTRFDMRVSGHPVPIYLFSEPDPKGVLTAYTGVTGRQETPPIWTFGPWVTALQGKGAVLETARRLRAEAVPASALWIFDQLDESHNLGWPFWFGSYYGEPKELSDTLHGLGFRVLTYVHPYVREKMVPYTNDSPLYAKAVKDKLLVMGADGLPAGPRFEDVHTGNVDFTNPAAVDWWQAMISDAVRGQGFDGWMEDFGEWVRDSDVFSAAKGTTMSMLYPLLYHKLTLRAAQAANPDVAPFVRSGAPGSQRFSVVMWGADQWPNWTRDYGLPSVVTAGITAGMSGFSQWGPDILSAGSSKELWIRWVQFGALSPVMRDHVWSKPDRTFNLFTDAETVAVFRKYAMLHSALLPYFVTYADEARRTGVPIMRHAVLEHPEDPRSAEAEYQYFLGHEILVAPVIQPGAEQRSLYLPAGEWVSYWSDDVRDGGHEVTVSSPLDQIPMLVRAGSILPFKPETEAAQWTWDARLLETSLVWKAFLSRRGTSHGRFALPNGTSAELDQRGSTVTISGKSRWQRSYEVVLRTRVTPSGVRLNGAPFPHATKPGSAGVSQWWWDPSSGETHLRFQASDFRVEVAGVVESFYGD